MNTLHSSLSSYNKMQDLKTAKRDGLSKWNMICYGVGHMFNDLTGSCWFTYGLFYMVTVIGVPSAFAGLVLLVGQIVDGVCTPLVGYLSDKTETTNIGKRTAWYLFGTLV